MARLSRVVQGNNKRMIEKIKALPEIYQVGFWAHYGVVGYPFSGKYTKDGREPLVWYYRDYNGAVDEYVLIPISHTTTGATLCWTFSKRVADKIANALEQQKGG